MLISEQIGLSPFLAFVINGPLWFTGLILLLVSPGLSFGMAFYRRLSGKTTISPFCWVGGAGIGNALLLIVALWAAQFVLSDPRAEPWHFPQWAYALALVVCVMTGLCASAYAEGRCRTPLYTVWSTIRGILYGLYAYIFIYAVATVACAGGGITPSNWLVALLFLAGQLVVAVNAYEHWKEIGAS